jgi:hypothetical protein
MTYRVIDMSSGTTLLPVQSELCNTENIVGVGDDERFPQG